MKHNSNHIATAILERRGFGGDFQLPQAGRKLDQIHDDDCYCDQGSDRLGEDEHGAEGHSGGFLQNCEGPEHHDQFEGTVDEQQRVVRERQREAHHHLDEQLDDLLSEHDRDLHQELGVLHYLHRDRVLDVHEQVEARAGEEHQHQVQNQGNYKSKEQTAQLFAKFLVHKQVGDVRREVMSCGDRSSPSDLAEEEYREDLKTPPFHLVIVVILFAKVAVANHRKNRVGQVVH